MTENVEIVSLAAAERWCAIHQNEGLPSHSWHYAMGLSTLGIEPRLAVIDSGGERLLLSFYERPWKGRFDIATVLGLSGAWLSGSTGAPFQTFKAFAKTTGWVAGYIQLAPSIEVSHYPDGDRVISTNDLFLLDLGRGDLRQYASAIIRRKIARAERGGAILIDDAALLATHLRLLYPATIARTGAGPIYDFPVDALTTWACDPDVRTYGALVDGSIEAISMFRLVRKEAEYQLNACTEKGRGLAAWLIWKAAARLTTEGVQRLNLGGGIRRGDGLADFKAKFGGTRCELRALCQVYDPDAYADLCRRSGCSGTSYFPGYRSSSVNEATSLVLN
jgi:hypothetical protein